MNTFMIGLVPLLLAVPSLASAEPVATRPVAVSLAGLDLATADGASILLARARAAAEDACRENAQWDRWSKDFRKCRAAAVTATVAKIGAPLVTALHRGEAAPTLIAAAK